MGCEIQASRGRAFGGAYLPLEGLRVEEVGC